MAFENNQVDLDLIPKVQDVQWIPLEPNYLKTIIWGNLIVFGIIGIAAFTVVFTVPVEYPFNFVIPAVWLLIALVSLLIGVKGFKYQKYALRDHDICYESGLLWRSSIVIPFSRIQHVDNQQGPIGRMLDLSSLNIYTAGGSSSDMTIPGIKTEDAQQMKSFILSGSNNSKVQDEEE